MCADSSNARDGRREAYEALIKPGDAVETPDGALWTVSETNETFALVRSAYRGMRDGLIHRDSEADAVETAVPLRMLTKLCDARQVRR